MAADRLISILGLGFGDCGKGRAVDAAVRRFAAHTVVRVNGGAQAGHNVVAPDTRQHTFSQFGAGTFCGAVHTVLAAPVVVHPTALDEEARALARIGVSDAFERLHVDPRCRVTTPFHQALGRLRELARGDATHGTCGVGFGETVAHSLRHDDEVLRWQDLGRPAEARTRLQAIRRTLRRELEQLEASSGPLPASASRERQFFDDVDVPDRWLARATATWRRVAGSNESATERLAMPGSIVVEGAQGVLLDENRGFHPHTTWSSVHSGAAERTFAEAGLPAEVRHLGVVRCYHTRHGAGPLPTEDRSLDALEEPHNGDAGWQGRFRRGHFDALLFGYALRAIGRLHGVIVTHLDAFERPIVLRWCDGYRVEPATGSATTDWHRIAALPDPADGGPSERLTCLLTKALPCYDPSGPGSGVSFVERLEATFGIPVVATSSGTDPGTFVWRGVDDECENAAGAPIIG